MVAGVTAAARLSGGIAVTSWLDVHPICPHTAPARGAVRSIGRVVALHEDELEVSTDLVRRLVSRSLPEYAGLRIETLAASGSTNALFRLGDELLVRLPRQPGGSATIEKEARWSPVMAAALTVPLSEVVAIGEPGFGYPEEWAVTRWIDGHVPTVPWDASASGSSADLARDLARTVLELRQVPVPRAALDDPELCWYRGGRLAELDDDSVSRSPPASGSPASTSISRGP